MKGVDRGLGATGPMGPTGCTGERGETCNALLGLSTQNVVLNSATAFATLKTASIPRHTLNDLNSVQVFFTSYKCDVGSDMSASSFRVRITSTSDETIIGEWSAVSAHSTTLSFSLDTETGMIQVYVTGSGSVHMATVGGGFDEITVTYEADLGAVGQQFCSRLMIADVMGISTTLDAMMM